MVIETKVVIGWFKLQLWMWLAYCLSNNNLASELVENRSLLNQPQSRRLWFLWLQWIKIRSANESPIYLLVKCNRVSSLRLVQRHTYMVTACGNLKNVPCSQTTTSWEPSMLQNFIQKGHVLHWFHWWTIRLFFNYKLPLGLKHFLRQNGIEKINVLLPVIPISLVLSFDIYGSQN